MKQALLVIGLFVFIAETVQAGGFVHPWDFKGMEAEKQAVIEYIKDDVKKTYTAIDMGAPATLRMMEKKELKKFKLLTKATNRKLLDAVIQTYCDIGMCNYSTINLMYNKQLKASSQELEW